jgi:hypothetical protein
MKRSRVGAPPPGSGTGNFAAASTRSVQSSDMQAALDASSQWREAQALKASGRGDHGAEKEKLPELVSART